MSKDEHLENSILTSTNNIRHCLYFLEKGKNAVGKTLLSSNEAYQLENLGKHQISVTAHEQIHIISTSATQFKRQILLEGLHSISDNYEFDKYPTNKSLSKTSSDFLFLYNSEIVPLLEAFALLYQCRLAATSIDLKDNILSEISMKNSALFNIMMDLEDMFEQIKQKCTLKEDMSAPLFFVLANLIFSTPNITDQRVFDRYRNLRDIQSIPEWDDYKKIAEYLRDYLNSNGYQTVSLNLGTEESILQAANFLDALKRNIPKDRGKIRPYLFGILSELDPQLGRISYSCKDFVILENKKINHCYMGNLYEKGVLFETDRIVLNNTDEVLLNKKYSDHLKVLSNYKKDMELFFNIKKNVFQSCLHPEKCKGKEECPLRDKFLSELKIIL